MLSGILVVSSSSPVRIAGGVNRVDAGMNYTVYGFAWCTVDLLPENCYQCLDHALMSYTVCCDYSLGGGAIIINCIVSYNILPFFNASLIQNASEHQVDKYHTHTPSSPSLQPNIPSSWSMRLDIVC
ncbi:hypothetical protein KSP40_PGU005365 [Platanthera guangdongensis]|uniref:Gnk2-homologous domain-containing protein n=1 Tax=Platanthera guangdongensis TaxID=2320717 RepID=A0ABR2MMA6_9ASPA